MDYLYIDESGRFEGDQVKAVESFVGGFLTTTSPDEVAAALKSLVEGIRSDPLLQPKLGEIKEANELHFFELYDLLDAEELRTLRWLVFRALRGLSGFRFVSCHYFADTEISVANARDAEGAQRFLRMWQSTVRNVLHYQPQSGERDLTVCAAQRSLPGYRLEGTVPRRYLSHLPPAFVDGAEGYSLVSDQQIPQLLLGILARGSSAPFQRRFAGLKVSGSLQSVTERKIAKEPFLAGLLLADMACDLIRHALGKLEDDVALAVQASPSFRTAYHPFWERYERLCEGALDSPRALEELVEFAIQSPAEDTVTNWIQRAGGELLSSLYREAESSEDLRRRLVGIASHELKGKSGRYPRSDKIFGEGGLRSPQDKSSKTFDEWIWRIAHANHTGREPEASRGALTNALVKVLRSDASAFFAHGESLAVLAVGLQDEFAYDDAVELASGWLTDARRALGALLETRPEARWLIYGRTLSNLAQSYAYRQAEGDLAQALAHTREARDHFLEKRDLDQWGSHALNLASLAQDAGLAEEALEVLYGTSKVARLVEKLEELRFGPGTPTYHLFGFSALSRAAVVGTLPLGVELRERIRQPKLWNKLFENIREVNPGHPVELYTRHLLELAPPECAEHEEQLLALALRGFGQQGEERVIQLMRAAAHAAYGLKLARRGEHEGAKRQAEAALMTLRGPFEGDPYLSTSTYCPELGLGWFDSAVAALEASADSAAFEGFLERYRYEWR